MKINISKILQKIYQSEISVRIESMYDMGYIWFLIDGTVFPRIWHDYKFDNIVIESEESKKELPLLIKDWLDQGQSDSFEDAVKDLCESILKHLPDSDFSKWWRSIN